MRQKWAVLEIVLWFHCMSQKYYYYEIKRGILERANYILKPVWTFQKFESLWKYNKHHINGDNYREYQVETNKSTNKARNTNNHTEQ